MVTAVLLEVCGHHRRDLGHQRHRVRLGDEEGEIVHHMFFFQIRVESLKPSLIQPLFNWKYNLPVCLSVSRFV